MKLFGFEITRTKSPVPATSTPANWDYNFGSPFWGSNFSFGGIQEPFTGAWQRNMSLSANSLLLFHAIYRCITLISQDISKMRMKLVEQNPDTQIWSEVNRNSPYWPVLEKPNRYQNRIQFFDDWVGSKLMTGNTYILKERDSRNIVTSMYILNPYRTHPRVADDGAIYYALQTDNLAGIEEDQVLVPASEIIHDRYKPLYHPLCGIPPILAAALSGMLGLRIQQNSRQFFENQSRPGGVLSAPENIPDETARRLKEHWENNYTGNNAGRIAVLGDGLTYQPMRESASDAQLAEQLQLSETNVCTVFGVPPYMIGVGTPPPYNNIEALNQQYYSQCLQNLIESIELLLDEGIELVDVPGKIYGTEFDLDDLLRMDTSTKAETWGTLVNKGIAAPNEGRKAFDLPPVKGGDAPYLQQQNYSLEALAKRDAQPIPVPPSTPLASPKPPSPAPAVEAPPASEGDQAKEYDDATIADFVNKVGQFARHHYRSNSI